MRTAPRPLWAVIRPIAAAERALHDVQFTATVRQERHEYYVGEAERWEHLAAHSARALDSKESQA